MLSKTHGEAIMFNIMQFYINNYHSRKGASTHIPGGPKSKDCFVFAMYYC